MSEQESAGKPRRPDPPALVARKELANELRPHVTRWVGMVGVEAVADYAKLKPDSVKAFINRGVTPQPGALDAYTDMRAHEEFWGRISGEMKTSEGS
jgi:hypothetical protein